MAFICSHLKILPMKKISLFVFAALAMASCSKTEAEKISEKACTCEENYYNEMKLAYDTLVKFMDYKQVSNIPQYQQYYSEFIDSVTVKHTDCLNLLTTEAETYLSSIQDEKERQTQRDSISAQYSRCQETLGKDFKESESAKNLQQRIQYINQNGGPLPTSNN